MDVDDIDVALINQLQADGRVTFDALARGVGLSRTATRARVQRLVDAGALRFTGVVHPFVYGRRVQGLVGIEASRPAINIAEKIASLEEAPLVSLVSGRFSVIAELWSPTMDTFAASIESIRALEGARSLETAIYTTLVKDPYSPPGEPRLLELDDLDQQILVALQRDGRSSFADLAESLSLSPGAVRARVLRLTAHGVVHVRGLVNPTVLGLTQACSFALWVTQPVDSVSRMITALPQVLALATAMGRCDVIGTIVAATRTEILETLDRIRQLAGISRLESWTHLTVLKENYEPSPLANAASS